MTKPKGEDVGGVGRRDGRRRRWKE